MICLEDVNKSYRMGENSLHVLKDVSLQVERGEFVSILGASGSGKSTLMNIIGCMDTLDTGRYTIDGISVEQSEPDVLAAIRNEKIGFIFQKYHLISKYSVLQNVMMPLLIRGTDRKSAQEKAEEILEMVGLEQRKIHKPNELSGGQQQRVAIARALSYDADVILADEPTGNLDPKNSLDIMKLLEEINERGTTVLVVTHNREIVNSFKKRVITMRKGVIVSDEQEGEYLED